MQKKKKKDKSDTSNTQTTPATHRQYPQHTDNTHNTSQTTPATPQTTPAEKTHNKELIWVRSVVRSVNGNTLGRVAIKCSEVTPLYAHP